MQIQRPKKEPAVPALSAGDILRAERYAEIEKAEHDAHVARIRRTATREIAEDDRRARELAREWAEVDRRDNDLSQYKPPLSYQQVQENKAQQQYPDYVQHRHPVDIAAANANFINHAEAGHHFGYATHQQSQRNDVDSRQHHHSCQEQHRSSRTTHRHRSPTPESGNDHTSRRRPSRTPPLHGRNRSRSASPTPRRRDDSPAPSTAASVTRGVDRM